MVSRMQDMYVDRTLPGPISRSVRAQKLPIRANSPVGAYASRKMATISKPFSRRLSRFLKRITASSVRASRIAEQSWQMAVLLAKVVMRPGPLGETDGCSNVSFMDLLKAIHSEAFLEKEANL